MDTSLTQYSEAKNLIKGIKNTGHQINLKSSIPLIADLRID